MRWKKAVLLGCAALAWPGAALAQVASGNEVTVNPVPMGGEILLYPGGEYARTVGRLKQPGETDKPIQLHMPSRHRVARTAPAAAEAPVTAEAPSQAPAIAQAPPRHHRHVASVPPPAPVENTPPPPSSAASMFGDFGPAPAAPTQATPAAPPGLTKRSMILFARDAPDPSRDSLAAIKFLAGDLNGALGNAGSRIQLQAFGGARGDKSSDARRLSLKRALAIRQVLLDDGVAAERIGVSAMGGSDDSGPADRVDVYLQN